MSENSAIVHTLTEAREAAERLGFPLAIKPSYTLAGTGSSVAANADEFDPKFTYAVNLSPTHEVLLEKPESAGGASCDQEFEEWWKGDKAGSALERAATIVAKYAWRESARRQMEKDCAIVDELHKDTYTFLNWKGLITKALRAAFAKEHPGAN